MTLGALEAWFQQRTGQPLPPAARLLMAGGEAPPARFQRHLVLHVADEETADGLMQWPQTRELIAARLGPTALVVEEEQGGGIAAAVEGGGGHAGGVKMKRRHLVLLGNGLSPGGAAVNSQG